MSRFGDYDGDGDDTYNGGDLWTHRAHLALSGKRGRKALAELREALMALPEKRLIEGALCSIGLEDRLDRTPKTVVRAGSYVWRAGEEQIDAYLEGPFVVENPEVYDVQEAIERYDKSQGEGVCAIGAYVWFKKVKAGMDPAAAFADMPMGAVGEEDTVHAGKEAGLTYTLAWELANRNDEQWASLSPEQRYVAFMAFIDTEHARPPLTKPAPKPKRERRRRVVVSRRHEPDTVPLGL